MTSRRDAQSHLKKTLKQKVSCIPVVDLAVAAAFFLAQLFDEFSFLELPPRAAIDILVAVVVHIWYLSNSFILA